MTEHQSTSCPTAEAIRQYAIGGCDDLQAERLETHLLACPECETALDALDDPSDALIQALSALPVTADDEEGYQALRARTLTMPQSFADDASSSELLQRVSRLADPKLGPLPRQLGNYALTACIGRGASGAVYRARHLKLDQSVAVKVLDESRSLAAESFLQEMKTIGSLVHPNIIRATDAGEADGLHFLVMEYVEGIDVARVLYRNGPLRIADACEIARQAALGLQFIHQRAFVHRDIKPSNLLLTVEGQVKVLDLGIAASDQPSNRKPRLQGTLDYMPPEQWKNDAVASPRSDIYSLGITLFKLLTGTFPKTQPSSNITPRIELPRSLDRLLHSMLAEAIDDRPTDIEKVTQALASHVGGADLPALVATTCPHMQVPPATPKRSTDTPSRRNVLLAAGSAAAAGLLLSRLQFGNRPRLQRDDWRPLAPISPTVWFSLGDAGRVEVEPSDDGSLRFASDQLALLHLGRPVTGIFSLEVRLLAENLQSSGFFFRGRADYTGEVPILRFQTIEFVSPSDETPNDDTAVTTPLLTWNQWTIVKAASTPTVQRIALGEVVVDLARTSKGQHLHVACGTQGMPVVTWNGQRLHASTWQLSTEGRAQLRLSAAQLPTEFLGRLGLVNSQNSTKFVQPRLAYL